MQGPTPWWDQPPDSRDNTVSMPRVDPAEFADRRSSAGSARPEDRQVMPQRPAFGDPYALPEQPVQAWPGQSVPDLEPAASPDLEAAASPDPGVVAPSEPDAAELADREADVRPEPEAAAPEPEAAAPAEPEDAPAESEAGAPRVEAVEAVAATEPEEPSAPVIAAWPAPEDGPTATRTARRAQTAAAAATGAPVAGSLPPESERSAPGASQQVVDLSGRDLQADQLTAPSRLAHPARSVPRPMPERQTGAETSLDARSVPAAAADRPAAGTIADLRARLARLPAGHPASPYDDTGRPKPAPTRLRMLELGLPAQPAGAASYADPSALDQDDESGDLWPDAPAAAISPAPATLDTGDTAIGASDAAIDASDTVAGATKTALGASETAFGLSDTAHGAPTLPPASGERRTGAASPLPVADDLSRPRPGASEDSTKAAPRPRPADEGRASDRRNASATAQPPASGQNGHRGRDASADWQRPYDVPYDADRSDGPAPLDRADLTTGSWPAIDVAPRNGDHPNGTRAGEARDPIPPESARQRARRSQPFPTAPGQPTERLPVAERPSRPVEADRISPALREFVDRILTACRAAEGRNAVGGYGNSGLTPAMMRIAAQLPLGGLAPGSEATTLKSADRLAAKLARLLARQPGRSAEQVAASIGDVIRYAFTFDPGTYTEGTLLVHRKLKTQGFELEVRRNRWDSPEYKGIFTRWRDPAHGLPFEVQFHTGQSWAFVKRTHDTYVRITDPATSPTERARLRAQQATAAEVVQQPPGCTEIADFRAGPREQPR